jgi:hypothetical protein
MSMAMTVRAIHIHAFCSVKGGVGKSTLATATAKLLARRPDRKVVLIDADMTGTSLADGLRLRAPNVRMRKDGSMDLLAESPAGPHYSWSETSRMIRERGLTKWDQFPPPPVYLNDILTYDPIDEFTDPVETIPECVVEPLLWKHEKEDGVGYLPSSPMRQDVATALTWLFDQANRTNPYPWIRRMSWLFHGMRGQMPELTDIVVDLPPGLVGFPHEMLMLLGALDRREKLPIGYPEWEPGEWLARPFLLTTGDRNDIFAAVDHWLQHREHLSSLRLVINKRTEDMEVIHEALLGRYGEESPASDPELLKYDLAEKRDTLGKIFGPGGDLVMGHEDVREIARIFRLEEV